MLWKVKKAECSLGLKTARGLGSSRVDCGASLNLRPREKLGHVGRHASMAVDIHIHGMSSFPLLGLESPCPQHISSSQKHRAGTKHLQIMMQAKTSGTLPLNGPDE